MFKHCCTLSSHGLDFTIVSPTRAGCCSLAPQSNQTSKRNLVGSRPSRVEGRIYSTGIVVCAFFFLLLFLNRGCVKSLFNFFGVWNFKWYDETSEITAFIWRKSAHIKALSRCFILILGGLIWKHPSLLPLEVNKGCFLTVSRLFHGGGGGK